MSIKEILKGLSIMDIRIPLGTTAVALLLLPLGYQLYSTTSMTPASISRDGEISGGEPFFTPAPGQTTEAQPSVAETTVAAKRSPT